jgi:hypothetical protein
MDLSEISQGDVVWMDVAQNKDWWRALVNTVMNFRVPRNVATSLSSCEATRTQWSQ